LPKDISSLASGSVLVISSASGSEKSDEMSESSSGGALLIFGLSFCVEIDFIQLFYANTFSTRCFFIPAFLIGALLLRLLPLRVERLFDVDFFDRRRSRCAMRLFALFRSSISFFNSSYETLKS
jgi:hypothetical protein